MLESDELKYQCARAFCLDLLNLHRRADDLRDEIAERRKRAEGLRRGTCERVAASRDVHQLDDELAAIDRLCAEYNDALIAWVERKRAFDKVCDQLPAQADCLLCYRYSIGLTTKETAKRMRFRQSNYVSRRARPALIAFYGAMPADLRAEWERALPRAV